MKKVILVAAVAMLALASCKKDHTCTCDVTTSGLVGTGTLSADTVFVDMKKSEAKDKCTSLDSDIDFFGSQITTVCDLK